MSGYCDTGKLSSVMIPANTIIMAITVAKIGRFMKKFENTLIND